MFCHGCRTCCDTDAERCSTSNALLGLDPPAVGESDSSANGKAQSGACRANTGATNELLEQLIVWTWWQAWTSIGNLDDGLVPFGSNANLDGCAGWRVLGGILDKVDDDLFEEHRLDTRANVGVDGNSDRVGS